VRKTAVYPAAPRLDVVDVLHGQRVADPYRWLEDPADERTVAWSRAQDELAAAQLAELPGREALAARMHALLDAGSVGAPLWRAGRRFWTRREPGQEHAVVLVRGTYGDERVLIDPMAIDRTGRTTLDAWLPDLEGRLLAYQVSAGGDEHSVLHVVEAVLPERAVDDPAAVRMDLHMLLLLHESRQL